MHRVLNIAISALLRELELLSWYITILLVRHISLYLFILTDLFIWFSRLVDAQFADSIVCLFISNSVDHAAYTFFLVTLAAPT